MSIPVLDFSPPDQCQTPFCIAEPHDDSIHVDYTGCTWDSDTGEIISGHDGE
jgi:hypothetical protein